jgi:hypothetical protein
MLLARTPAMPIPNCARDTETYLMSLPEAVRQAIHHALDIALAHSGPRGAAHLLGLRLRDGRRGRGVPRPVAGARCRSPLALDSSYPPGTPGANVTVLNGVANDSWMKKTHFLSHRRLGPRTDWL